MVATEVKIAGKMLFNLNGGDPSQVEAASEATLVSRIPRKTANGGRFLDESLPAPCAGTTQLHTITYIPTILINRIR